MTDTFKAQHRSFQTKQTQGSPPGSNQVNLVQKIETIFFYTANPAAQAALTRQPHTCQSRREHFRHPVSGPYQMITISLRPSFSRDQTLCKKLMGKMKAARPSSRRTSSTQNSHIASKRYVFCRQRPTESAQVDVHKIAGDAEAWSISANN